MQISLQNTFNQTTNALSIVISKEEVQQIEEEAEKSRAKVREMFATYRPGAWATATQIGTKTRPSRRVSGKSLPTIGQAVARGFT